MSLGDIPLTTLDGRQTTYSEFENRVVMVVNVASKCGFTPQYAGLEKLYEQFGERGLTILGFPCNQFGFQESGNADDIQEFCSLNYGVTFPLFEKTKVNGRSQHPLYAELTRAEDASGKAGKVKWNFEKFVVTPDGTIHRFRSTTEPGDPAIVGLIEKALAPVE